MEIHPDDVGVLGEGPTSDNSSHGGSLKSLEPFAGPGQVPMEQENVNVSLFVFFNYLSAYEVFSSIVIYLSMKLLQEYHLHM